MNRLELEDFVYMYPDIDNNDIQGILTEKEEFREVEGLVSEPVPKPGQLFRHQKFFQRLMRQYDSQFVIWQTGVGKACGYITVAEYYKHIADDLEIIRKNSENPDAFNAPYRRAYILVKGKNLINETKNQILCKCTAGDYITPQILNSKTDKALKSNITRSINKFYEIMTYGDFAKAAFALSDAQMKAEYENCIFIIDEVHNINDDTDNGFIDYDVKTGNAYYKKRVKDKETGQYVEKIVEHRLIYDQIWRVLHGVKTRKAIILSATPMINNPSELPARINLILPENLQMPANINWDTVNINELQPYFNGRISYVRALDTGAIPVYQGELIDAEYEFNGNTIESQYIVYGNKMKGLQLEVYDIAVSDPKALRPESDKPEAFNDLKRQVANFVFPNKTTGDNGFNRYVKKEKYGYSADKSLIPYLSDLEKLKTLSIKFAEIVRLCKSDEGNCWCYLEYIKGAGVIVLSLCFQYNGFELYNETTSAFGFSSSGKTGRNICFSGSMDSQNRNLRIKPKRRIALLTSENNSQQQSIIELFNSYENRNGDYIKVIIGSPQSRDGLNLSNVLQIHLAGPGWNQASSYQAESRAIRSTSHVDLIADEKARLQSLGLDPETARVEIKIYRHAALDREEEGIDIERYELSESKDIGIKRIMRMMKQISVDCHINYKRNVRFTDVDGSAACDYDVCAYTCINPSSKIEKADYTSKDVLYLDDTLNIYKQQIIDVFKFLFKISKQDLYLEIENQTTQENIQNTQNQTNTQKYIDLAIIDLIENKIEITNRYGFKSYLIEDRDVLFLTNSYPTNKEELALSEYSELLILTKMKTLESYNTILQKEVGLEDLDINELTLENKISLIENAIDTTYFADRVDNDAKDAKDILETFSKNIFKVTEPLVALEYVKNIFAERGKGRGRKPKSDTKLKLKDAQNTELESLLEKDLRSNNDKILFHNITSEAQTKTSYATNVEYKYLYGKLRLRDSKGWRDSNDVEEIVYNKIIFLQSHSDIRNKKIYAKVDKKNRFSIVDRRNTADIKDRRKIPRGRECNTINFSLLIDIAWDLDFHPFKNLPSVSREEMLAFFSNEVSDITQPESFSNAKLKYFYDWYTSGSKKEGICDKLRNFFEDNNLIEYI